MAIPTVQQVKDTSVSGQFASVADATIQAAVDEAAMHYGSLAGQAEHTQVVALHAAHILACGLAAEGGGGVGPLSSVGLGPARKSFAVGQVQPGSGVDATTTYGRRLLGLLRSLLPSVRTPRQVPFY